ncbi:GNAT family N-acetyltransferase [Hymenobacter wooponensis]|uniref:GNAT family N-acetyltransferase n=1 Tax=Hymenobacter wooponensis TaxID=1525360 RepID=A0A4Z0MMV0_9BACT|nr:GNAT family N-acetyltransferase [Hymenobacter wooponensis]TGD80618.1 GNAT family N-acetyltransferase [Hymenobacter wooponensis]
MILRRATLADIPHIGQLFYDTITQINSADYSPDQVEAWRGGWQNTAGWQAKVEAQHFLVAEAPTGLAGFASLRPDGYLDFLFVSAQHQRQGIAKLLLHALLQQATLLGLPTVHTDASRTARPFFAHYGFEVEGQQQPVIRGVEVPNFRMVKLLTVLHSDTQL